DVVRCEVLDDPDIRDSAGERPLTARGDLVDLTDQAIFDARSRRLQGGVVPLDVAHAADQARRGEERPQLSRLVRRRGDRLLDEGVDAAFREGARDVEV